MQNDVLKDLGIRIYIPIDINLNIIVGLNLWTVGIGSCLPMAADITGAPRSTLVGIGIVMIIAGLILYWRWIPRTLFMLSLFLIPYAGSDKGLGIHIVTDYWYISLLFVCFLWVQVEKLFEKIADKYGSEEAEKGDLV